MIEEVSAAIRAVAVEVILPRFDALESAEVEEKSPGELVTVADREAEVALTAALRRFLPGAPVVGEETCAADPRRLAGCSAPQAWLVDPIDGTTNFVSGSPEWAVMVARLDHGEPVASWIWQPVAERMYVAERGSGADCNGVSLRCGRRPAEAAALRGAVLPRFLDAVTAAAVARNRHSFSSITDGKRCAGFEYPAIVEGEEDFAVFWRTLPWDHAPGVLLLEEAGGWAARPDGSPYRVGDDGVGLVAAADAETWELASGILAARGMAG